MEPFFLIKTYQKIDKNPHKIHKKNQAQKYTLPKIKKSIFFNFFFYMNLYLIDTPISNNTHQKNCKKTHKNSREKTHTPF